jgi:Holliday junction DNA helicase RuvA
MIAYLKGQLTHKSPTYVIVECEGVGYKVNISLHTHENIPDQGDILIYTYLQVREDAQTLYGFADEQEKEMFLQLIGISGVGASVSQTLLSSLSPAEVRKTIMNEDVEGLKQVKGIGAKTAKRLILELKDTLVKQQEESPDLSGSSDNRIEREALSALEALGFGKKEANATIRKVMKNVDDGSLTVEQLVKEALKHL